MAGVLRAMPAREPGTAALFSVSGLTKVYPGGLRALEDVSFAVERPEVVAIIGSSGAGKSTLIRCINRLVEPTSGEIRLGGIEIARLSRRELRQVRRRKNIIWVEGLDAVNGSPVLDIKPYFPNYDAVPDAGIPEWARALEQ